jgi:transcriptional regulator with XRE-family HTH domain
MIKVQGIGDRLRTERERLGLSQGEFADLAAVARTTAFRYETGAHSPSLEFLEAIEAAGADVEFIVSGQLLNDREDQFADAMCLVDDLLKKHGLDVPYKVRARLVSHVLTAHVRSGRRDFAAQATLSSLLELITCGSTK